MIPWFRGYALFIIVFMVGLLMLANIYWIHRNNRVIELNKERQAEAEMVKVNTVDVIRSLHLLDLSVRSYVFVKGTHFLAAIDTALANNDEAFRKLESSLKSQQFPMTDFYHLRDSVASYIAITRRMISLIDSGGEEAFVKILRTDPGYNVWLQHAQFSHEVKAFENEVSREAKREYEKALQNTYILQILLFLLAIPTLGYTAFHTNRSLAITEKLRKAEAEKSLLLLHQNQLLERAVLERTREIVAQSEEIASHNEQLMLQQREIETQRNDLARQNENMRGAKEIIEEQSKMIRQRNRDLGREVEQQTRDLRQKNLELVEKNSRLEQFAFIISHNLRSPMARLVGLSALLDFAKDNEGISEIVSLMVKSTQDLDQVVKDLTLILDIQKMDTSIFHEIHLDVLLARVLQSLQTEIQESGASIEIDFSNVNMVTSLSPYMESIFYNLISNAIKYRHPDRLPDVRIKSKPEAGFVRIDVSDNGLGIDVDRHRQNLFNLYRRFHFHVNGRGMGLYLVKAQITAMGGNIEVISEPDKGTVFSVFIKHP